MPLVSQQIFLYKFGFDCIIPNHLHILFYWFGWSFSSKSNQRTPKTSPKNSYLLNDTTMPILL